VWFRIHPLILLVLTLHGVTHYRKLLSRYPGLMVLLLISTKKIDKLKESILILDELTTDGGSYLNPSLTHTCDAMHGRLTPTLLSHFYLYEQL